MNALARRGALDFTVPSENEAREPAEARGVARDRVKMLVSARRTGKLAHARFDALASYLEPGDVVVVNDSATLPAVLRGRRADGSETGVHVADELANGLWVIEPRDGTHAGETLWLPGGSSAIVVEPAVRGSGRLWHARVTPHVSRIAYLRDHGTPIRYAYADAGIPLAYYQTIFARANGEGSAEMPSAARPFTAATLDSLRVRDVDVRTITLHAGVSSPEAHEPPQDERYAVPAGTAEAVDGARARGRRIIAIGTTVVRALESSVRGGRAVASSGRTDRIVSVENPPAIVDGLLTGFHEPRASQLAMLETFLSRGPLERAYRAAIEGGYLWHEFGDVHLIV